MTPQTGRTLVQPSLDRQRRAIELHVASLALLRPRPRLYLVRGQHDRASS